MFLMIQILLPHAVIYCQAKNDLLDDLDVKQKINLLLQAAEKKRLASSGFDIRGVVTDVNGIPLNGVELRIELSRPNLQTIVNSENKNKTITINSEFHIQEKGWTDINLSFMKNGYYSETRSFNSDHLQRDLSKRDVKEKLQVIMTPKGPVADLSRFTDYLKYDFKNNSKIICNLSKFQEKKDSSDKKKYEIEMFTTNSDAKEKKHQYLELDIKRDINKNIILDSKYGNIPCPSSFVIRFCSDSPNDGIILISDKESNITQDDFKKKYTIAPEEGYSEKEIYIDLGQRGSDGHYPCELQETFFYFKIGNHYGKAFLGNILITNDLDKKELSHIRIKFMVYINKVENDRNLTSFL